MKWMVIGLCALLFLIGFAGWFAALDAAWDRTARRRRLTRRRTAGWERIVHRAGSRLGRPYAHVADLLASVRLRTSPASFAGTSILLAGTGLAAGMLLFQSPRSAALLGFMAGGLPYLWLRMRLISRQLATRLEFLPAVELFYQCYLITGSRHVRTALHKAVDERRLPGEVQAVFEQLARELSVGANDDESLRRFSLVFDNAWSDYFVSILRVGLTEGNNVADNLKELIADMRKAQLANQQERHRLLEIRLANFTPVLFLALFLGINFRINPEGSYRYYMLDPVGRGMLLNALALLFGSLLMGIYLSRRRM